MDTEDAIIPALDDSYDAIHTEKNTHCGNNIYPVPSCKL